MIGLGFALRNSMLLICRVQALSVSVNQYVVQVGKRQFEVNFIHDYVPYPDEEN